MTDVNLTVDPEQPADASRFFAAGQNLLHLLDELTDVESRERDWTIVELRQGSAVVTMRSTAPEREQAAQRMVEGLAEIRAGHPNPTTWTPGAVTAAQTFVRALGPSRAVLKVAENVIPVDFVLGTRLESITPWVREMPGALRGTLTGFNVTRGNRASLKLESGRVVRCSFSSSDAQRMADALLKFVEIEGKVRQDGDGVPYWINADTLRVVAAAPLPWESLIGLDPTVTDGLSPAQYLAGIRGED